MASALDPSAIGLPQQGQSFGFADEASLTPPRPAEDVITGSTSETVTAAVETPPSSEPASMLTALSGSEPVGMAPAPSPLPGDAVQGEAPGELDPATARIYNAAGQQDAPAARPPVSGFAKRTGSLLALFSNNRSGNARKALIPPAPTGGNANQAELWSAPSSSEAPKEDRPVFARMRVPGLPGVNRERALGQDDGASDRGDSEPLRVASAAGLARLAPNGLKLQHDGVDVKCLKPALVRVLKKVERHYGSPVIVTSGFRSANRNKKARGSSNSLHMYCSAADIQIEGVSKWQLAEYLRDMPGRGGVGTYCHTNSVHIDIGPKRDWNWRCRRKK